VGACLAWKLLAGLPSPTESADVQDRGEVVEKPTIVSRGTQHEQVDNFGATLNDLLWAPTCHVAMHVILLHSPHIGDGVGVVLLECVDIGERGWKRYAGPVEIFEIGFSERRFTQLWPPHLFREQVAEPSSAHGVLETQVVCLRCLLGALTNLCGVVNVDQAMFGYDRIGV
jgi:hypothetical protein